MKQRILIIILTYFALTFCYGQSTLQVNIKDCRGISNFEYLEEFKLYKNNIFLKVVEVRHEKKKYLKDLSFGNYSIEYKSIFGKIETIEIELKEDKKYVIDLCLNYMDYDLENYKPFINQLKNGDSYSIQVLSQGCFHNFEQQFIITRKDEDYFLTINGNQKQLNKNEIIKISRFEIELNYMESSDCTTIEQYVLKFKDKKIVVSDGSCSWNGFLYLFRALNLTAN